MTDDERVALYADESFAVAFAAGDEAVGDRRRFDDEAWCALHNDRRIDLLERCSTVLHGLDWSVGYPLGKRLARLLPGLTASTADMTTFLLSVEGTHLGMGAIAEAVKLWLRAHPDQCRGVVRVPDERDLQSRLFTLALQACDAPDVARQWLTAEAGDVRSQALNALCHLEDDDAGAASTIVALSRLLPGAGDDECALLMRVAVHLAELGVGADLGGLVSAILASGGSRCRQQAAQGLRISPAFMASAGRERVVDALGANSEGGDGVLDETIRKLVGAGYPASAVRLAERVGGDGPVEALLQALEPDMRVGVVLGWLYNDDHRVLPGVEHYFTMGALDGSDGLVVPPDVIAPVADRRVLVGIKAVAWLHHAPGSALAIVVALLPGADGNARDPLLKVIRGLLRDHPVIRNLVLAAAEDQRDAALRSIVDEQDAYIQAVEAMARLPELRPSVAHRAVMMALNRREMQASSRAAEAGSTFLSLINRVQVLHGAGTLHSVRAPDGTTYYARNMMATVTRSFALPSTGVVDPIGYEMRMISYRVAGASR